MLPLVVLTLFLLSCQTKPSENANENSPEAITFQLTELWSTDTIMKTPESVLYDPARNVLFVANINGNPTEKDGNGFISKLNTDGTVDELEWVTGIDAPKGMGIYGDLLFVTDIDHLVVIDIPSAAISEKVPVEGANFLNDVTIGRDGTVYFSDMRSGKIHTWKEDVTAEWKSGLEGVNGLFDEDDDILVNVSGKGEVQKMNKSTGEAEVLATGIRGDGVEYTGYDGYYIVSEWSGRIHVIGNGTVQKLIDSEAQKINTADIGYNLKEKIVYVPTFFDNRVVAYKLEKGE
jgi:hypothetical protein